MSLATLMVVLSLSEALPSAGYVVTVYAVILIIFCVRVFLGHGGERISPLGIWMIIMAVTGGFSALVGRDDPRVSSIQIATAAALVLLQSVGIAVFAWGRPSLRTRSLQSWTVGREISAVLAWAMLFMVAVIGWLTPVTAIVTEGVGFVCVLVIALTAWARDNARLISIASFWVLLSLVVYVVFLHTGSGRLRIAALGLGMLVIASLRFRTFWIKTSTVILLPLVLAFMAWYRVFTATAQTGVETERTGLESLTDPLITFSHVIGLTQSQSFEYQGFTNLLTPIGFLFPDDWELPEAFGYELVSVWNTDRFGSGYSAAATSTGEWFWMAGIVGVLISTVVIGMYLRLLHKVITNFSPAFMNNLVGTTLLLGAVIAACALGDMAWGGGHVYIYRSVVRIATVIAFGLLLALLRGIISREQRLHPATHEMMRSKDSVQSRQFDVHDKALEQTNPGALVTSSGNGK